eukprot:RCo021335
MVKSAIQVVVRIRPTDRFAHDCLKLDGKTVSVFIPKKKRKDEFVNNQQENFSFKFDDVLNNCSQEAVFAGVGQHIVSSLFDGYNGTIMAYGQTGAGKTYTMSGGSDFKQRGLVPRVVMHVFNEIANKPELAFEVRVSYMEIYNERLFDLLSGDFSEAGTQELQIQEDSRQGVSVKGLQMKICSNEADALSLFFEGNTNRAVSEHAMNANSTRSHTVFTVYLSSRSRVESDGRTTHSKLHLVDLAGSERLSKTGSDGATAKEAMYINKSLTFLEQVVVALTSPQRDHIPYRQSRLTNLLKDSLGGNTKTVMIANIWGEELYLDETSSTLRFASRMMRIHNEASVNMTIDPEAQIRKMAKEIAELKSELQMQNQLHGKSHITYTEEYTEDEKFELQRQVRDFVGGRVSEIDVKSLRQVKEMFKIFKVMIESAELEASRAGRAAAQGGTMTPSKMTRESTPAAQDAGVGEVDGSGGFGIGTAIPAKVDKQASEAHPLGTAHKTASGASAGAGGGARSSAVAPPDRNEAFEGYKSNEGAELAEALRKTQVSLREKKKAFKDLAQRVNDIKTEIDRLRVVIESHKTDADEDEEVVDVDYFRALTSLKEKKNAYRTTYDEMQAVKTERDYETRMVEQARQRLVAEFGQWYDRSFPSAGGGPSTVMPPIGKGSVLAASATMAASSSARADQEGEALDEGERFDMLQKQRIMEVDPESLTFYGAKKAVAVHKQGAAVRKAGVIRR